MATLKGNLTELIAQKERIASEVNSQSEKITAIKSDIYDILESDEIPQSKLNQLFTKTITEVTEQDLDGAKIIESNAFYSCKELTSVVIPKSVTTIGANAFQNCNNLKSVNYLGTIDDWLAIAFNGSYTAYSNPLSYGANLYANNELVTQINVTKPIHKYAFMGCGSLTSVIMSDSVTSLDDYAFFNCKALTSVKISEKLSWTAAYVFYGCTSLTNLTIPTSVTSISNNSLQIGSEENKATITFLSTTPPSIQSNSFKAAWLEKIIVPKGYLSVYLAKTNWANFAEYIVEATE